MAKTKRRWGRWIAAAIAAVLVVACVGFAVYVSNPYRADETALEAAADQGEYASDDVEVQRVGDMLAFVPENASVGLAFYPGGLVEAEAYAPLLQELASRGVLCVLCPMPLNLAVLNGTAADGAMQAFPQVDAWYVGGHSLGGVVAANYAADHADVVAGLVMLAAYPAADLSGAAFPAIAVRGTEDGVLNYQAYLDSRERWPQGAREVVLKGGNHSQFGSYGHQKGDGEATMSPDQQWEDTAAAVASWMSDPDAEGRQDPSAEGE
ncbi:alpha/beta hydrolase [Eggerthellaceae bacterium zg-887]|uniref:alpha/beta fold hydrolase n=1 Tax=Xiamenia xianingshaonis TaxID=2682776 RepID=UPI00140AE2EF|nr:alpha/beta fold hydrolase [Xiamenia xianingshaonis]NHM16721.1 alpha/beta hydrolase [Xiamenia xianingshaonis]